MSRSTGLNRVVFALGAASVAILGSLILAPAAHAADGWARDINCGTNNRCAMSSTTSAGVSYYLDGGLKASWATSGYHSWSGAVSAGSHLASMGTNGSFSSHNAYCYCPPGAVCGA